MVPHGLAGWTSDKAYKGDILMRYLPKERSDRRSYSRLNDYGKGGDSYGLYDNDYGYGNKGGYSSPRDNYGFGGYGGNGGYGGGFGGPGYY